LKHKIDILSLFPDYFRGPFDESIIKRAKEAGILQIALTDIRAFSEDKHNRVDDRPYGGGPGMVIMPGPVSRALASVRSDQTHVVYLSPQGSPFTAQKARDLAKKEHLVLLCGHYEGIDQRALDEVDEEISIGDYVLTNGCVAAIVLVDAMIRFIDGVLGDPQSAECDSFEGGLLDCPHYTRPELFEGKEVPQVLRSGHHAMIEQWRLERRIEKTRAVRPDLFEKYLKDRKKVC
jgi:tRNA (guanine37-N1)-methyltransferase